MKEMSPLLYPRRWVRLQSSILFLVSIAGLADPSSSPSEFKVLPGFEVSVAAASPLVNYPMMACLDDRGRLYIAESDGRNLTTREEIEKERPRFVRRLVDQDGDGVFDTSTIFADEMTMPEGGLWHQGALYIISAPYLWRLEDLDDDGVADKREKILGSMEFDGRANQHGPYLGPNGRLYFTGGHFGYDLIGSDGSRSGVSRAAGVFSCWPDGRDVRVEGQGGVNPVDVVFTPNGDMLSTCAIFDSFGGRRHDALIHWMRGGLTQRVYGNPLLPETGFRLPAVSRWGQVAPAGLVRYRGTSFGASYRDTLFACQFNAHKVVQVSLEPQGGSFLTVEKDFLSSERAGFHPADILEDVDGSLLLLDTGGWLSWGCPFSKNARPEIKGAVYRIQKDDALIPSDPRGNTLIWDSMKATSLIGLLKDTRPAVRDRAVEKMIEKGGSILKDLEQVFNENEDPAFRKRCLWTVSRIQEERSLTMIRSALLDADAGVRQVAARSLGERKDAASVQVLAGLLQDTDAFVRGAAATALGLIGDREVVPDLFQHLNPSDPLHTQHAFVYALTEIGDLKGVLPYLRDSNRPYGQRMALRVIDALDADLEASSILPLLHSTDPDLRQETRQMASRRKEWKPAMIRVFRELSLEANSKQLNLQLIESLILSYAQEDDFQSALLETMSSAGQKPEFKEHLLNSIAFLEDLPETLETCVLLGLKEDSPEVRSASLKLAARFKMPPTILRFISQLEAQEGISKKDKVDALKVLFKHHDRPPDGSIAFLIPLITDENTSVILSLHAAQVMGALRWHLLDESERDTYLKTIARARSFCLPALMYPFEHQAGINGEDEHGLDEDAWDALGVQLAAQLERNPAVGSLPNGTANLLRRMFSEKISRAYVAMNEVLGDGLQAAKKQEMNLRSILQELGEGNASRGRVLFYKERVACASCHRIDSRGGQLGPDLSQIGRIRQPRDLVEAVLYPSATVVNGYENYAFELSGGETLDGMIHRETREAVYLINGGMSEMRIDRKQIEHVHNSTVSLMPSGFEQILSRHELLDLIAYLQTCR
ncbi:HEAT repeat domain-containing protein [Verrucomicrobia bacterium]|nr:HEAT repeat domain-containing protein [bacterium]MDB4803960.1 HEAT repeat domain-containing protein [Verrucomicrobiota bacterium]